MFSLLGALLRLTGQHTTLGSKVIYWLEAWYHVAGNID